MIDSWGRRIERASELAGQDGPGRSLLLTYGRLLGLQRACYHTLHGSAARLSGDLERDLPIVRPCAPPVLIAMGAMGPPVVAEEATRFLNGGEAAIDSMLLAGWRTPSGSPFLSRMILQPYAESLASVAVRPADRHVASGRTDVCPFCGGAPQLSTLQSPADSDGGGRQLVCAMCSTAWSFHRLRCAHCGEEDEHRLGYFHSPAFDHLRVDTCDTCRHYLKTVDLTRFGLAVPVVDEVAGAPLDLWARESGFEKIELNLVGL